MLSEAATTPVSIGYAVHEGTATGGTSGSGIDFKTVSGTAHFNPSAKTGETPTQLLVTVQVFGDTTIEGSETFTVDLANPPPGYTLERPTGTGTIINDDPNSGLSVGVGDATIVEGNAGSRTALVPIRVPSPPGTTTVTVPYTIQGLTATHGATAASGNDFGGALSGTLTFTGSTLLKTLVIPIYSDIAPENDETIQFSLGTVAGANVTRATGTVTILNDD